MDNHKDTTNEEIIREMVIELRGLAPCARQHEALMRARGGADFDRDAFEKAASLVECERLEEQG